MYTACMHTTCIGLHVVQRSAVSADIAIRLIVETPPVSVKRALSLTLLTHTIENF